VVARSVRETVAGQSPGPRGGSEDADAPVREATEVFQLLLKGIKNIGIYRHAEARFAEYLEPAHRALERFLERHDSLPLKLEPFALKYQNHVIYEDQDRENLTYKFYKDGVRYLIFRRGLPLRELLNFVLLSIASLEERQLFQEDMVTRLWKQDFQFIEHIVVEGFGFGDLSEEEVEVEVEKVIGYLRKQLAANSEDIARFARLSLEDLELEMSDVEQVRGGIISGRPARPQDKANVQDDLLADEKDRMFTKMVLILFQILEFDLGTDDYDMLSEALGQFLDSSLLSEDIAGAVALSGRFDRILARDLPADRRVMIQQLAESTRSRMVEPHRVEAVANYMNATRSMDRESVEAYFACCRPDQVPLLLDLLSKSERPDARSILIATIANLGRNHLSLLTQRLEDGSSNLVRDILEVVERIDPPNKFSIVAKTLKHTNLGVRLEGLKQLAKSSEPEALRHIERAAADRDVQIRLGAYRALVQRAPRRATEFLIREIGSDVFASRDHREKTALFAALGYTKSAPALRFLAAQFEQKAGLFQRGRTSELKLLAITGLTAHGTLESFAVLKREIQNRSNGKDVMLAARQAALKLREKLKEGGGSRGPGGYPSTSGLTEDVSS
jgi:HEAT repeat protein